MVKLPKMIFVDYSDDIQKLTDEYISKIDQITKDKEKEIMEV